MAVSDPEINTNLDLCASKTLGFECKDTGLWTEKYYPKDYTGFIGNSEIVERVKAWAESFEEGKREKPLLFVGPPGIGKTCLALLTAKLFGWDLFELNASDLRDKESIERFGGAAAFNRTFSGKPRLILIDEVDGLQAVDRGGASAITTIIKESPNPVILTANDIYQDAKLAPIRTLSEILQFKKINYLSIAKFLREIARQENLVEEGEAIKLLAQKSEGDLRSAMLDLQCLGLDDKKITPGEIQEISLRDRQQNIFNVLKDLYSLKTFNEIRRAAFAADVSSEMLMKWVEENIPRAVAKRDLPLAFSRLSRADLFDGRIIRRQCWDFKRYVNDLMTSGVSLSRSERVSGWIKYEFPKVLKTLSKSMAERAMKKEIGLKIGKKINSSSKAFIREDLPFMDLILLNKEFAAHLVAETDITDKELAYLMKTKADTKKVQQIMENALKIKEKRIMEKRFEEKREQHFEELVEKEERPARTSEEGQRKLF